MPVTGQTIGEIVVEGLETIVWPRGSIPRKQTVTFTLKGWQAIGGAAAFSLASTKYLLKQVEELAGNRDAQPVFIQWDATAMPNAALNASDLHDGWYVIDDFQPDYSNYVVTGLVNCRMTVTFVAPPAPRSMAMAYAGGALASNFSGGAQNLVPFLWNTPQGTEGSFQRVTADGGLFMVPSPVSNPLYTFPSGTVSDMFHAGVRVYDAVNIAANPIPTNGAFVHANWVEVFGTDHDFLSDCIITNGLLLLQFQAASAWLVNVYLFNTALAVAAWQNIGNVGFVDNGFNTGTLRAISLKRVGREECAVDLIDVAAQNYSRATIRLQKGRYEGRLDLTPLVQAPNNAFQLVFNLPNPYKAAYNGGAVRDVIETNTAVAPQTDWGYGALFPAAAGTPWIAGFLYVNQTGLGQPYVTGSNSQAAIGDTIAFPVATPRSYGFFAIPFGVSGTYSTANLQVEMENLGAGGFVNVADATASAGNAAKLPNGTAVGATDTQAAFSVTAAAAGAYDVWARVKVTSAASGTKQLRLGNWEGSSWGGGFFTDWSPSQFTTAWAWYRVVTNGVFPTNHQWAMRAEGVTNAAATDFFIDEMVMVPKTLTADNRGPQDIWQQFMYDRDVEMIVL